MQRDIGVSAFFAKIDFTGVKGLRVDVKADGPLLKFGEIEDLMDGLERIDVGGMRGIHFIGVRGNKMTCATVLAGGVMVFNPEILNLEAADGSRHPAILVAMIVYAAELSDFPADSHTFKDVVLENEIPGIAALGPEEIFPKGFRTDLMGNDEVLDVIESEIGIADGGEFLDPIGDMHLHGGNRIRHKGLVGNYSGGGSGGTRK